jgi:hypothetical protein
MLVGDSLSATATELLARYPRRASSRLLEIEAVTAIRRAHRAAPERFSLAWVDDTRRLLSELLRATLVREMDAGLLAEVRRNDALGACRSLDAIHVATATLFASVDPELLVCTLDHRMRQACHAVGLPVADLPAGA